MEETFFNPTMETMSRPDIDALVEGRIQYTINYALNKSPFYRRWFLKNKIDPKDIRSHEDLLELPIISGKTILENQPPKTQDFRFKSANDKNIFIIHETSGTSGTPKSFHLTWTDWERFAEKYARAFVSQGFGEEDILIVCTTYGKNVGASTMTLAAKDIGMTIIPEGNCKFPSRVMTDYKPTAIVGNVFKLLRLARRLEKKGYKPHELGLKRLVIGGEAFSEEARTHLERIWNCPVYNIYGSTEGTMCGECTRKTGLHVPEDLVHLDLYDPRLKDFVPDGECGRIVLTTLLPIGAKAGTLLLNYDTEDTSVVLKRKKCSCGRTHMKIINPQREAETFWIEGTPFNRVDVERGVFQDENLKYLTGEYESILKKKGNKTVLEISVESMEARKADKDLILNNFTQAFLEGKTLLGNAIKDGSLDIDLTIKGINELNIYKIKGRPKRVVDLR